MIITEKNYYDYGNNTRLDLTLDRPKNKAVTEIQWLPKGIKIVHLGNHSKVTKICKLPYTVTVFTCTNLRLKYVPNVPHRIDTWNCDATKLPDYMRICQFGHYGHRDKILKMREEWKKRGKLKKYISKLK